MMQGTIHMSLVTLLSHYIEFTMFLLFYRFFLSVLQHQKSSKLEWIIIILIAGEMIIGLIGLGLHLYSLKKDEERDQRELLRDEALSKAVKLD